MAIAFLSIILYIGTIIGITLLLDIKRKNDRKLVNNIDSSEILQIMANLDKELGITDEESLTKLPKPDLGDIILTSMKKERECLTSPTKLPLPTRILIDPLQEREYLNSPIKLPLPPRICNDPMVFQAAPRNTIFDQYSNPIPQNPHELNSYLDRKINPQMLHYSYL